ncbi:TPA: hypothetical protein I9Z52_001459 [Clostridium perfringens]|nr:hypothetical protein [Clostridium perfringens]
MKFRYRNEDEMKDSDIEWIGKIPKHWNSIMFKRVIQRVNNGIWGDDAKSNSDDIPCIRVLNFNRNTMEVKIDNLTIRNIPRIKQKGYLLKKGDLLIEKSGGGEKSPVGFVVRYNYELPAVYANFMAKISLNNNTISEYIKYLCSAIYNRKLHLDSINQTTGIQNLDSEIYFKRYIALPNVLEQEKIAKFLDEKTAEFDSIISKKEALIKKLEEAKKSLISEVVTGKVKIVKTSDGYELVQRKKEEMKNSGVEWLGEIPKEWKITKLKLKTIQVNRGKSPEYVEESKIKIINQACIYWDCFNLKNVKYQNEINLGERGKLYKNDILINSTGTGTLGRANIFKEDGNFIADSHVTIIRCKDKSFADYLKYVFRTDLYQGLIYSTMVTGSTNQIELSREGLRNMIVLDISNEELNLINNILEDKINKINLVIDKTKSEIEKLKEAKQSLISEAVTGKIEILE